ncbi:hypothetical protein AAAC51_31300 [Priestia megaterium]
MLEKIQSDEIDIAITTQRLQIPGIEYTVIEEEEFVLTVPPSFEMTASKDVEDFYIISGGLAMVLNFLLSGDFGGSILKTT